MKIREFIKSEKQSAMKKNYYFMIALWAILFSACSSDAESTLDSTKTAKVVVSINSSTRSTATTEPTDDNTAEKKISRLTVAVFNSSEDVLTIQEDATTNPTSLSFDCPLSQEETGCTAIVVANAPSGHFAGATTKTAFLSKTFSLSDSQTSNSLPMSGEVKEGTNTTFTLSLGGAAGDHTFAVALSRLVARVIVKKIATDFSSTGAYSSSVFKLTNVFVRNALSTTKPATGAYTTTKPDGTLAATNYLTGSAADTGLTTLAALNTTAATGWDALASGTHNYSDITNFYYFYVFANENSSYPTTLVLEGTFDTDGDGTIDTDNSGVVYYPVVINKNQTGTTIKDGDDAAVTGQTGTIARGMKYQLEVTIRSKGVSSPSETIDPASLTVTVTVTDWTPYTQSVSFD